MARFSTLPPPVQVVISQPMGQLNNSRGGRPQQEKFKPDLLPMTYTKLYPKLVQSGLLSPVDIPPLQPPYPRWYNENVHYDYHSRNKGHSTKNCTSLKRKVKDLIKKGGLTFEDEDIPDVNRNPLPNHGGPRINTIESSEEVQVKRSVKDVRMHMKLVHEVLVRASRLESSQRNEEEMRD